MALLLVVSTAFAVLFLNSRGEIRELQVRLAEGQRDLASLEEKAKRNPHWTDRNPGFLNAQFSAFVLLEGTELLDPISLNRTHGELAAAVRRLREDLPVLRTEIPLTIQLVQRSLWLPGNRRAWLDTSWVPILEFPISGVTQVDSPVLEAAARNLTTRALLRSSAGPSIPGWLLVGTSAVIEQGALDGETFWANTGDSEPITVRQISAAPGESDIAGEEFSRAFVSFLIDRSGWETIGQVLTMLGEGKSPEDATLRAFGVSLQDLEVEWRELRASVPAP